MKKELIYLGCPYSHPDPAVKQARFETVTRVASRLVAAGYHVYSPITHSHPMAEMGELPGGWDFWEKYDRIFLEMSKSMFVLKLEGWEESTGLQAEIKIARELGIPVEYIVGGELWGAK